MHEFDLGRLNKKFKFPLSNYNNSKQQTIGKTMGIPYSIRKTGNIIGENCYLHHKQIKSDLKHFLAGIKLNVCHKFVFLYILNIIYIARACIKRHP